MKRVAIYPGTFDPLTNGHIDLIERGLAIFDGVTVSIAPNPSKKPLFTAEERLEMTAEATKKFKNVQVELFEGLLIDHVINKGANVVIRGLRAVSDFEFELQMALMNRRLSSRVETVFMTPSEEYSYISSTIIKEVAALGGDVSGLVPDVVLQFLKKRIGSFPSCKIV